MRLIVNGTPHDYDGPRPLSAFLESLGIRSDGRGVAVALNDSVVPRRDYAGVQLKDGDRIEIIEAVQGG
ncbi:MAG: sulfur carrier protein ThiS [Candidatus Eisenbacteria bacterium]|nr:sulfur carrier protein ThiS [Candidatus Eisenbacteria bacterium]